MIYIQVGEDNYVEGYSSNRMYESDLLIAIEELEERFFNSPIFYKVTEDQLIFDEDKLRDYKMKKKNRLTNEQKLGQKCSDLEIQLMMMQQLLALKTKGI